MGWNYRVIRTEEPDGTPLYAIHEVYYAAGKAASRTAEPVAVLDEERGGLLKVLAMMAEAVGQPTLNGDLTEVEPAIELSDNLRRVLAGADEFARPSAPAKER